MLLDREAEEKDVPPFERVKLLAAAAAKLDEFLMVRFGAVRALVAAGVRERSPDGTTPKQQLKALRKRVRQLLRELYRAHDALLPILAKNGVRIDDAQSLSKKQERVLDGAFRERVAPLLTPLACDPGHPLPFLASGALNLAVVLSTGAGSHIAFIQLPHLLPRFIGVSDRRVLPVEELIRLHAAALFPALAVQEVVPFRVLRTAEQSVKREWRRRQTNEATWLEVAAYAPAGVVALLQRAHGVHDGDVYYARGLLKLADFAQLSAAGRCSRLTSGIALADGTIAGGR